jgi:hypothetical protein
LAYCADYRCSSIAAAAASRAAAIRQSPPGRVLRPTKCQSFTCGTRLVRARKLGFSRDKTVFFGRENRVFVRENRIFRTTKLGSFRKKTAAGSYHFCLGGFQADP